MAIALHAFLLGSATAAKTGSVVVLLVVVTKLQPLRPFVFVSKSTSKGILQSLSQGFTAIYADGGICGIYPATRSVTSDQQLCFTWYRLPRI
eukprot:4782266-Pleurochrysis_carterae.AAC.1